MIGSLAAAAAAAHHNPGFYFDLGTVVIHRDVTAVSFTPSNPHGRFVYTMADADGAVTDDDVAGSPVGQADGDLSHLGHSSRRRARPPATASAEVSSEVRTVMSAAP